VAGAGGQALVHVVEQAGPLLAVEAQVAVRDLEEARDHPQRPPRGAGRQERPEVELAVGPRPADQHDARELVLHGQLEVGEVLVVAQQDVVGRAVLLDQVVLEDQGLDLAAGDDHVEVPDLLDHRRDAHLVLRGFLEVAPHAALQRQRLADVEIFPAPSQ